ncbi:MAG: hydrogenase expression/formation protein HypE [Anaerolineales bacterium]|jgi:hydrogenase expression/formation protein HypE|nr:hydrogenase expression/formation protein HypE [Anaerolineales bacterium]
MSQEQTPPMQGAVCPLPLPHTERIVMGHGSGGKMTHDLVARLFLPALDNPALRQGDDAARIALPEGSRLAVSVDAHVVAPLFFPGGDIGRLAVCGTVNDISMLGAKPQYLTAGFILEEGLEMDTLQRIVASMQQAAAEAGVQIIAGDTKVVQKGKADGLYITTSGVGVIPPGIQPHGANARPGDVVIISGTLGDHAVAVLAARNELGLETAVQSDVAPLNHLVEDIFKSVPDPSQIHVLRDPTRGGLGTTLNEIARHSQVCIQIQEKLVPVQPAVQAACEMLGFDPLYLANEGKLVAIVEPGAAEHVLMAMRSSPLGKHAAILGTILPAPAGRVTLQTPLGVTRIIDMLAGEILPRIC